jgi:hypothetical protein
VNESGPDLRVDDDEGNFEFFDRKCKGGRDAFDGDVEEVYLFTF